MGWVELSWGPGLEADLKLASFECLIRSGWKGVLDRFIHSVSLRLYLP